MKPEIEGNNGGHHSRVSPQVSPEIVGVAGKKEEGGGFARRKEKVGEPTVASTSAVAVAYLAGDRRNPPSRGARRISEREIENEGAERR